MRRFSRSSLNNSYLLIILIIFADVFLYSQDTLSYKLSARKDIFQYDWNGLFRFSRNDSNSSFSFRLNLQSNYYAFSSSNNYFNDKMSIRQQFIHKWFPGVRIGLFSNYDKFNNQQVNLKIDHFKNYGLFQFQYREFQLAGLLGNTFRKKYNKKNNALFYGIKGTLEQISPLAKVLIFGQFQNEQFSYNSDQFLNTGFFYSTKFTKESSDSIRFSYSVSNYADYFNQNLDLEKVNIQEFKLNNYLVFFNNSSGKLSHIASVKKRDFSQDRFQSTSFRKEIEVISVIQYLFEGSNYAGKLLLKNYLLNNDYNQNFLDNEHLLFDLKGQFKFGIGSKHFFEVTSQYSKLEYNTPDSTTNFDDRDELRGILHIDYTYRPNPNLQHSIFLKGRYFYQKYIYKERSALNNKEIILSLGARNLFKHRLFRNHMEARISTYYLIHDYSQTLRTLNDIINRRIAVEDSLTLIFNRWNLLTLYGRYEKEEIGSLDWSAFAYSLERENSQNQFYVNFQHYVIRSLSVSQGFSIIRRKDFIIPGTLRLIRNYNSKSFWIRIIYRLHSNKWLTIRLQRFIIDDVHYRKKVYLLGKAEVFWRF